MSLVEDVFEESPVVRNSKSIETPKTSPIELASRAVTENVDGALPTVFPRAGGRNPQKTAIFLVKVNLFMLN